MRRLAALLALGILTTTAAAQAGMCGDHAGAGARPVPCACGDVLVDSRTLTANDPITQGPCPDDGLLVRVDSGRGPAVLKLAGYTISGSGRGIGVEVQRGGDGGITVSGPGVVRGFHVGILATGALSNITDVAVADNRSDGLRLAGQGYHVSGCEARDNGGAGFFLRGSDYRVTDNRAHGNRREGFSLGGRRATIEGAPANESSSNGGNGVTIAGHEHAIAGVVAMGNGGTGLRARIGHSALSTTRSMHNAGRDLRVSAHDSTVDANAAGRASAVRGARLSPSHTTDGVTP